uniref:Uncharacterized protein n=1 Tax=viral metagenome TaxID=1070528 RepID=A0A6C0DCJ1_9ZZZZ
MWLLHDIAKGNPLELRDTLSKYFCPLIWNSIKWCGYDIPDEFYKKPVECDQKSFDNISRKFAFTKGWG